MYCYYKCPLLPNNQYYNYNHAINDLYRSEYNSNIYTYPQNLPGALKLIVDSVAGEREDEMFYNYLINAAPNEESRNIITGIRNDEMKHNSMLRTIYTGLTRKVLPPSESTEFNKPASYCEGLKNAIKGETDAVKRYRTIHFAMQNRIYMNMIMEILTDELRHASLYNLLFSLGKCTK